MTVQELITKLNKCNPNWDVVLARIEAIKDSDGTQIAVEEAGEDDWIARVDHPLNQVFIDNEDQQVCIFTAHDDHGNNIKIDSEKANVIEL